MFEQFTADARRVVALAGEEAYLLRHSYIGTEHLLLGILAEGTGVGARILRSCHVSLDGVRQVVGQMIPRNVEPAPDQNLPFNTPAKNALRRAFAAVTSATEVCEVDTGTLLWALIEESSITDADLLSAVATEPRAISIRRLARTWRHNGMDLDGAKELEKLREEHGRLKRLLAEVHDKTGAASGPGRGPLGGSIDIPS